MPVERNISILCNRLAGGGRAVILGKKISDELQSRNIEGVLLPFSVVQGIQIEADGAQMKHGRIVPQIQNSIQFERF